MTKVPILSLHETYKLWAEILSASDQFHSFSDMLLDAFIKHPVLERQMFHCKDHKFHGFHPDEKSAFKHLDSAARIASVHRNYKYKRMIFKKGLAKPRDRQTERFLKSRFSDVLSLNFDLIPDDADWYFKFNDPHYVIGMVPIPFVGGKLLYHTDYGPRGHFRFGTIALPADKGNYIDLEGESDQPVQNILIPSWLPLVTRNGAARIFNTKSGFVGPKKLAYLHTVLCSERKGYNAEGVTQESFATACKTGLVSLYDYHGIRHSGVEVIPETIRNITGVALTGKHTKYGNRYAVIDSNGDLHTPFEITDYHIRGDKFLLSHENGKSGVWDAKNVEWIVKPIWDAFPETLVDDCLHVKINGKSGVIRTLDYSKDIVPCKYETVTSISPDKTNLKHPFFLIGADEYEKFYVYTRQGVLLWEALEESEVDTKINSTEISNTRK